MKKNPRSCTALQAKALWLQSNEIEIIHAEGGSTQISIEMFSRLAGQFWAKELSVVGSEVIQKLEELYSFSMMQNRGFTSQSMLLLHIYQVSQNLKDVEQLAQIKHTIDLSKVLQECKKRFFDVCFPLKRQMEDIKGFIKMCEEPTAKTILEDIARDNMHTFRGSLTHGQIGRLQVLLPFLTKIFVNENAKKILEGLSDKPQWEVEQLWLHVDTFPESSLDNLDDGRWHLVQRFAIALKSTFVIDWKREIDYISPHIYLILLEKLFFLSSPFERILDGLVLPRSFLIEFLIGQEGKSSCTWLIQGQCHQRCDRRLKYDQLYYIVYELLRNKSETLKWIEDSNIDVNRYFPELVVRLIVILGLICINTVHISPEIMRAFQNIFNDKQISECLPSNFRKGMLQVIGGRWVTMDAFMIGFSEAMIAIDNPLVMIDMGKAHEYVKIHEGIIVVTQERLVCKDAIFNTIFQTKDEVLMWNRNKENMKGPEVLKCDKEHMASSNQHSCIDNTDCIPEPVRAEEQHKHISEDTECLVDDRETKGVFIATISDFTETSQQQKGSDIKVETNLVNDKIKSLSFESVDPPNMLNLKVDGWYVPWFVSRRLKRWLYCARNKLEEQLSMKDKYVHEAQKIFQMQGKKKCCYTETFISEACPLKAEVDEHLDKISTAIQKVNQDKRCTAVEGDILEELYDTHEELQQLSELLTPRHEKHGEGDIRWLKEDAIEHISMKLQESQERLNSSFELIIPNGKGQKSVTGDIEALKPKSKQSKKKAKPKGHKKKRK